LRVAGGRACDRARGAAPSRAAQLRGRGRRRAQRPGDRPAAGSRAAAVRAALPEHSDGDGRTRVSLAELIALGARIGRAKLASVQSRSERSGQQSSRLYGRGMDYAESRAYQPGDDVRRMDWRLTARSGKLHTKLYQEEREGRLLIL